MLVEVDEQGVMKLPDEIIEKFNLCSGDTVHFEERGDGCIVMTFPKKIDVEIDLSDDELLILMKMAHEQDITFNQFVEDVLREEMEREKTKKFNDGVDW